MSQVDIKIPSVGESITEATMGKWNFQNGDWVEKDAVVFEIETEKATMEVTAPASGKLNIQAQTGTILAIGAVAGSIDSNATKPAGGSPKTAPAPAPKAAPASAAASPTKSAPAMASSGASASVSVVSEDALRGLGPGKRKAIREGKAPLPTGPSGGTGPVGAVPQVGEERVRISTLRKKIAERLLFSQQSTATLTTFNEVDMTNLMSIRAQVQEKFQAANGVKLGFMSFFAKAVSFATTQVRIVNARLEGDDIVYNEHMHLGVAVSTDRGLVVPVLRFADQMSYADIEKGVALLAEKARTGKLGLEEMVGGTFTLTNGGTFGSLLSTPILNPPQSGILGMHKIEQRPMAIQDASKAWKVEVRPMMYIALSYDHRLIDGRDSVTFLVKVKEYLETVTLDQVLKG